MVATLRMEEGNFFKNIPKKLAEQILDCYFASVYLVKTNYAHITPLYSLFKGDN